MDSMRHLSKSLPNASRRRTDQTELLSSFKAAALSVTNLYKTAAANNVQAREAGYQDALDDLLAFVDKENIGLGDGEGWQVRKWILERFEDAPPGRQSHSDDEEDVGKGEENDTRSSSPEASRKAGPLPSSSEVIEDTTVRPVSEPPPQQAPAPIGVPSLEDFTFRNPKQMPVGYDRDVQHSMELDAAPNSTPSTVRITAKPAMRSRVGVQSRRDNHRNPAASALNLNVGSAAGSKRRFPFPDFFDISGMNFDSQDKKDGGGRGGKKGRHV